MAMKRIKDVAVKVGSYTDRSGATKNKWKNVGSLVQFDDGGQGLMLDTTFNPAGVPNPDGRDSILLSFFDIKTDGAAASGGGNAGGRSKPAAADDDILPF